MKVMFFGLGSVGKRHAKILSNMPEHQLFAFRSLNGSDKKPNSLNIQEVFDWKEIKKIKPEVAFIGNPTFLHIDTALKCAALNMKLFMEKPIDVYGEKLDLLIGEIKKRQLASYVAYNLRFHPCIKYLKGYLKSKEIYHASVCCCSFFAKWRHGQDHLKSFSAIAEKGGGVILELSHEFDYIDYLFGEIQEIQGCFDKRADVTKDAEDYVNALIKTDRADINLHINFFSQRRERTIKIDCKGESIVADLINNKIEFHAQDKITAQEFAAGVKETYKTQIDYFFKNINNTQMMNNIPQASVLFRKIVKFKQEQI